MGWVAVRLWAFFLLGFHLAACLPYGWLVRQLGGLPPIFPLPFPLESLSLHGSWSGFCRGSPLRVVSSCSFLEGVLPPLWRWRVWMVESSRAIRSSGRFPGACLLLSSSPLALHGVVSTSPVCLSRAPAFRQVRVAMLAEGSVESPSVLVLAFHSSLFLVEGSSDGSAPGDRFLSPGRLCLFTPSFCWDLSLRRFLSWGRGLFFLLCLSVYCQTWWHLSSRKLFGVPVGFTSSSPLLGGVLFDLVPILSWVFSPGFGRGFLPLSGGTTPVWSSAAF